MTTADLNSLFGGAWIFDPDSGIWIPCDGVPISDRGFRFGMHVFETIAVRCGRMLLGGIHSELLDAACVAVGFPMPAPGWMPALMSLVHDQPDGVVRVFCTAGDGSPTSPVTESRMFAFYEPMTIGSEAMPEAGSAEFFVTQPGVLPWVKVGNYWPHLIAQQHAWSHGAGDAVLTTPDGWILSGALGNVFACIDERWTTPVAGAGVRPGAVREWLIRNTVCETRMLHREELARASAVFVTNSRIGLRPLGKIGNFLYPNSEPVRFLWNRYRQDVLHGTT